jgi:hypothetical protein
MSFIEKDCEESVIDLEVGGDGRMISERPTIESGISEKRPTESRGFHQGKETWFRPPSMRVRNPNIAL